MSLYIPRQPAWTIPDTIRQDQPDMERNNYVPLRFFVPFPFPIPENKAFGDCFITMIADRGAPVSEVAAFMHMPLERIYQCIRGTMPAPNGEQLLVAGTLLRLKYSEYEKLLSLAEKSWIASGLDIDEQRQPKETIFDKPKAKPMPVKKSAKAMPTLKPTETLAMEKTKENTPPDLRMKVRVDLAEVEDGTIIREIMTEAGDCITIDGIQSVERDTESGTVRYRCRHGKHRVNVLKEDHCWYIDGIDLAVVE